MSKKIVTIDVALRDYTNFINSINGNKPNYTQEQVTNQIFECVSSATSFQQWLDVNKLEAVEV